jgi:hypothetical protein
MRHIKYLILFSLFFPVNCWSFGVGQLGSIGGVVAGGSNPCSGYLFCQNYEGTGYDNGETWTAGGTGTINPDYTTTVLEGSQSLLFDATAQAPILSHIFSSTQSEIWGYFLFRPTALPNTTKNTITIKDYLGNNSYTIEFRTTGGWLVRINGSGATAETTTKMTTGTTYHCWYHVKNGSGNAVATFGFSTDGTEPTSGDAFNSKTNGTEADVLASIDIGWIGNATMSFILDKMLGSITGTIGNQ